MALYLKYRPQSLSELIGQEMVKKTLTQAFENNKLSHAYLFVGPRGTGKTSTARILAKMVNCEEKNAPCNKCEICLSITDGSNLDLIEIDAASNRGIEDIRALRDKIKLAPNGKKKVYIIDEVHMLTQEAFNALLKTLEEPPAHALFILATTEGSKIPQTILSRVQRLDFKLASQSELLEVLQKIVKAENMEIDEDALKLLVKRSDGSFRDGVKLFDQISSGNVKITKKIIEESLKTSQMDEVLGLMGNLTDKDTTKSLLMVTGQIENGVDFKEFIFSLMDNFRSLILIKHQLGEQLVKPNLTEEQYSCLGSFAQKLDNSELIRALDILQKAQEKLKFTSIPSLPLELAVVEICSFVDQYIGVSVGQKASELVSQQKSAEQFTSKVVRGGSEEGSMGATELRPKDDQPLAGTGPRMEESTIPVSGLNDIQKIREKWTFVLETIRPYNFSLEALLRSINVTECSNSTVYIEVPYAFHQRILEAPKNRDLLEGILSDILGRTIKVTTVLGERVQRREDIANIEMAADDEIIRAAAEIFNSDTVN